MDKSVLDILIDARNLLARPYGFVRGRRATREHRVESGYAHCALGAIEAADGVTSSFDADECTPAVVALDAVIPSDVKEKMKVKDGVVDMDNGTAGPYPRRIGRIAAYNNTTDQETVVAWFDRAIEVQREHPTEKVT